MTLVGVKINNSVTRQSGPYCFKIQGELHHLTGALLPHGDHPPTYAQIYILDTAEQLNVRRFNNRNLDPVMIDNLQTMLLDSHPYIGHYCHAYELIREKLVEEQEEIPIRLHVNLQQDQRTNNLPTAEEIAVIIPEEGVHYAIDNRDVVLRAKEGRLEQISQNSSSYAALQYVLLFSKGENRWYPRIPICGACKGTVSRVMLSKSSELTSTKALYPFMIAFPLFLASSVCIIQCDAFYFIFRTMCDYRLVPGACVPDHLL